MALNRHVVAAHGASTWDALLEEAGTPGRLFMSLRDYPDADVLHLVATAARLLGVDAQDVLKGFGRSLVTDLMSTYGSLVSPTWTAFDLLEHTEATIHAVVRARTPTARPPVLTATRRGPELVSLVYASERRLCSLAQGIVLGIGDRFGTPLEVHEPACMRRGSAHCQLEVLPAFSVPQPRSETGVHRLV
jgi:hypothetical protein